MPASGTFNYDVGETLQFLGFDSFELSLSSGQTGKAKFTYSEDELINKTTSFATITLYTAGSKSLTVELYVVGNQPTEQQLIDHIAASGMAYMPTATT